MRRLDRLGWTDGFCFEAFGLAVGIRSDSPEVIRDARRYIPPGAREQPCLTVDRLYSVLAAGLGGRGQRRIPLLFDGPDLAARARTHDDLLRRLDAELTVYLADRARTHVLVHAAVAAVDGRAILLPGPSGSGKTTLVKALIDSGATYYSDECAVLDAAGMVHPYPRPLGVRDSVSGIQVPRAAEKLGAVVGRTPAAVSVVAFTRFRPNTLWRVRRLSGGRGVLSLAAHAAAIRREPLMVLETLQRSVREAIILRGTRGDASEAAEKLLAILGAPGPEAAMEPCGA